MEIHQLRYFLAVAQTGSFSRAAELCHVAQPSLSQQIAKLERELQERLFDRERHGAVLTEAGERLLPRAERALGELQLAQEEIRDLRGQISGPLRLGVLPTIAPYYLPKVLPGFLAEHPAVELSVFEETTQRLVQALRDRELDLALLSPPLPGGNLVSAAIFTEELLLALPPGHPLAERRVLHLEDLREEAFILLHESHCLGEQALVYCRNNEFRPKVSCRSEQLETVKQLIVAGLGVSLLPAMACTEADPLAYRRMSDPRPSRAVHVVWGKQQSLSRASRAFRRFVAGS